MSSSFGTIAARRQLPPFRLSSVSEPLADQPNTSRFAEQETSTTITWGVLKQPDNQKLANCHFYAGHYDTAEVLNQQLLPVYRGLYGEHHPRVADILINLGAIRHDRGQSREAESLEREALE